MAHTLGGQPAALFLNEIELPVSSNAHVVLRHTNQMVDDKAAMSEIGPNLT